VGDVWDGIGNGHGKCRKYVDGAFALSGAVSSALPGTLRHVIDLHAQAPVFFLPLLYPSFTLCILVKKGPTALLNHTISHFPARTSQRKGRQMCINRAVSYGGLPVWVFGSIEA